MRNKFFFLLCFLLFIFRVDCVEAEVCDTEDLARMKVLSKSITADYNYVGNVRRDSNYQLYEVAFHFGELDGSVFIATSLEGERVYHDSEKLYVDSGNRQFHIYSVHCAEYQVGTISINLPKFNIFSMEEECSYSARELEICDEWYQGNLSYTSFRKLVDNYYQSVEKEEESDILNFAITHYVYFVLGGIVFVGIFIFLIIRRIRRNRLD